MSQRRSNRWRQTEKLLEGLQKSLKGVGLGGRKGANDSLGNPGVGEKMFFYLCSFLLEPKMRVSKVS